MWTWITRTFWTTLWQALQEWNSDDGPTLAASLAYYGVLSLFPLLIVLIAVFGYVLQFSHAADNTRHAILVQVAEHTSPELSHQLDGMLEQVKSMASVSGPIGLTTLLFGAIGIFAHLDVAFGRIWKVPEREGKKGSIWTSIYDAVHGKLRAFLMMLGLGMVVLVAFIANMVLTGVRHYAHELPLAHELLYFLQTSTGVAINTLFFTLVYKALSKRHVFWGEAAAGGLLAGIAWEIGRQVLAALVIGKSYSAYGVVGSFIALLLWFFYASCLLFLGAEFVQVLTCRREKRPPVTPDCEKIAN